MYKGSLYVCMYLCMYVCILSSTIVRSVISLLCNLESEQIREESPRSHQLVYCIPRRNSLLSNAVLTPFVLSPCCRV